MAYFSKLNTAIPMAAALAAVSFTSQTRAQDAASTAPAVSAPTITTDASLKGIAAILWTFRDGNEIMCGVSQDKSVTQSATGDYTKYEVDPANNGYEYYDGKTGQPGNNVLLTQDEKKKPIAIAKVGRKHGQLSDDQAKPFFISFQKQYEGCAKLITQVKVEIGNRNVTIYLKQAIPASPSNKLISTTTFFGIPSPNP